MKFMVSFEVVSGNVCALGQWRTTKVVCLDKEPKEDERKSDRKEISPPLRHYALLCAARLFVPLICIIASLPKNYRYDR